VVEFALVRVIHLMTWVVDGPDRISNALAAHQSLLTKAGWQLSDRSQVRFEIPVDGYDADPWNGVTDYCLYNASGHVLAVVEAKRCSCTSQRRRRESVVLVEGPLSGWRHGRT
jgi:hypothetical protein